jgi:hypothetical protein
MATAKTIAIATVAASGALAVFGLLGQPALAGAGLGLFFSLANEILFAGIMRFLSRRRLSSLPKAAAWLLPVVWMGKQAILLVGMYLVFEATQLPVLPFVLAVIVYQFAHVGLMLARPEQYARYLLSERSPMRP